MRCWSEWICLSRYRRGLCGWTRICSTWFVLLLCLPTSFQQVVQRYIDRPFLLSDRLKFDLRIYVLLISVAPTLDFVVFRDGLARFATETYKRPTARNIKTAHMHLTNFSLNKATSKFRAQTSIDSLASSIVSLRVSAFVIVSFVLYQAATPNDAFEEETSSKRSISLVLDQVRSIFCPFALFSILSDRIRGTNASPASLARPFLAPNRLARQRHPHRHVARALGSPSCAVS